MPISGMGIWAETRKGTQRMTDKGEGHDCTHTEPADQRAETLRGGGNALPQRIGYRNAPAGLAGSFGAVAAAETAKSASARSSNRERHAERLLAWLEEWSPAYLRFVFASERKRWAVHAWYDLERDAIQHALLAGVGRGASRWADTSDEHALRWTKLVMKNFVISECSRTRIRRESLRAGTTSDRPLEAEVLMRRTVLNLLAQLRSELGLLVRPRDRDCVLRSFDELVAFSLAGTTRPDCPDSDKVRQRRKRVRRLIARAMKRIGDRMTTSSERQDLVELAVLLGTEND
jgi:hypothetical protein